jgi:hypothetical protein
VRDDRHVPDPLYRWLEGLLIGFGYSSALASLSVFLVASFRPQDLPWPYWVQIQWLRTDTFGFICFVVASITITLSEYLRLSPVARRPRYCVAGADRRFEVLALVAARTLAVAGSTLVIYLSVNSVTHPATLLLQATHFLSWPTESTLRVGALVVTACAVAVARSLRLARNER